MSRSDEVILATPSMMMHELRELKDMVHELREVIEGKRTAEVVREISIHQAARMMGVGDAQIKKLIRLGKLPARRYKDKNNNMRYRIREKDLAEMQITVYEKKKPGRPIKAKAYESESSEAIADRIFPGRRSK